MSLIAQVLANAISAGGIYAVIAIGYSLIYSVLKFINFAHGEIVMIGAFIGWTVAVHWHQHLFIATLAAMICCGLLGFLIEKIVYKPFRKKNKLYVLLTAIALSFLLQGIAIVLFGAKVRTFSTGNIIKGHEVFGAVITTTQFIIITVSLIFVFMILLFIKKTKTGKAIRAVAENQDTAAAVGINVDRIISIIFILSSMLAAVSGILIGYEQNINPTMGTMIGIKAFTAAVVGGIGSVPGAFLGGYLIGFAENFGILFVPAGYKDAISFVILLIMLYVKPTGILGKKTEEEVRV